jgi:hypothetical protein
VVSQRFVDLYPPQPPPKYPKWAEGQPPCAFSIGEDAAGSNFTIDDPFSNATASNCRRLYYAAVTATDHYIGLVLDELSALGLSNGTAVALFGDHGWHLGERTYGSSTLFGDNIYYKAFCLMISRLTLYTHKGRAINGPSTRRSSLVREFRSLFVHHGYSR